MMTKTNMMLCPDCGVEMNQHAEKIDYSAAPDSSEPMDIDFGGALEEIYACPACGRAHARRTAVTEEKLKTVE
jgi:predicted RNA-binding Zn-ribbon protein involved in translation (DUF1610 family)